MKNCDVDMNIKLHLKSLLNKVEKSIFGILKKYDTHPDIKDKLDRIVFEHSIYRNRRKIERFNSILKNSDDSIKQKILDIKEESDMRKKRKEELVIINDFIKTNIKDLLSDNSNKENKKLLPLGESEEKIEKKESDDILLQDTEKIKNEFISKKRKSQSRLKKKYHFYCYTCKHRLIPENIHEFYGNLCKKCGNYNYSFRTLKLDLSGRIAIVTGGRIKIGFYIASKLLSYGCKVIVTSRFPKDALFKFKEHEDYETWKKNLIIYPIDFRFFESTIKFINYINDNFPYLDILINNAAQTLRRTTSYYKYLLPIETKELNEEEELKIVKNDYVSLQKQLIEGVNKKGNLDSFEKKENKKLPFSTFTSLLKIMDEKMQPNVKLMGNDGQPYDFSHGKNSWNLEFDEIPFEEFIEVQIINSWTPYYLCTKLKPLMLKSPFPDKYIVNVTAVEGIFNHFKKTTHVHTNMAKAELNMFTRTCGKYLKNQGIYMTCVDTGWVSPMNEINNLFDENKKEDYEEEYASVPLDELDGAMRVLHPIIEGVKNKNYLYGILLKDYIKSDW